MKYLKDSIDLIKNISMESKNNKIRLRNIILSHADEFSIITNAIQKIDQYKSIIEPAGKVAWNEVYNQIGIERVSIRVSTSEKSNITIFEFFFLDLLQIIEKSWNKFQVAMAICRNIPLIDRGIKEYKEGKDGK